MDADLLALLGLVAVVAGFIDAIAGGGGLLSIPALLLSGMPPLTALGTNKLQAVFGSGMAAWSYARKGHSDARALWPMIITSFAGSLCGVFIVSHISQELLRVVIPILLLGLALFFMLQPQLGRSQRSPRISAPLFAATAAPLVGFYDGIFGPGTGSFFMLAFVMLLGLDLLKATASTKLLNFSSNIAALGAFVWLGTVDYRVGLVMGLGQFVGARIGALTAMRFGVSLIRALLIIMSLALALRLVFDPQNPLRDAFLRFFSI